MVTLNAMAALMVATATQGPAARTGVYVVRVGGATIAQEEYRFDGTTLTSQLTLASQGLHLSTETRLGAALSPERYTVAARSTPGGPAIQDVEVAFADSARWTATAQGQTQHGATALAAPFMVLQNLQFSHIALAFLRYDRTKGGAQRLNAWLPRGAAVVPVEMTVEGDSGTMTVASQVIHVWLDASGWLIRATQPAQGLEVQWQAEAAPLATPVEARAGNADTVAPASASESRYAFASGDVTLVGTLTLPKAAAGKVPVALIVAGSGPTDRNGNSRLGVGANTYAQLAWRLAEHGIASLRYDKRGLGESGKNFDMAQTTFDDFVGDVVHGARALSADSRFSKVVLIGHSEGAGLALRAVISHAPVAGLVMLAGVGRPMGSVLHEQLAAQFDAATMTRFDSAFAAYLRGAPAPSDLPAPMEALLLPVNRKFLQTGAAYRPAEEIRTVRIPVLIVQGEKDIQVGVVDARALAAAKPDATLVLLPDANHTFKLSPGAGRESQAAQYRDPTLPIDPGLTDAIVRWMASLR